jgi:hypothetical protein
LTIGLRHDKIRDHMGWEANNGRWDHFSGWNYQPGMEGSSKDSVCPMYQLVEHCAELAGLDLETVKTVKKFCGWNERSNYSHGPVTMRMGAVDSEPYMMCVEVSTRLGQKIEFAKADIMVPGLRMGRMEQVEIDVRNRALRDVQEQREIIAGWKEVMIKNSPVEEAKVEDISDEEAIKYVELCCKQLNHQAAGEGEEKNGDNCKERPKSQY